MMSLKLSENEILENKLVKMSDEIKEIKEKLTKKNVELEESVIIHR